MRFVEEAHFAKFENEEGSSASGSAMTLRKRAPGSGPTGWQLYPSCACCYRPVADKRATYCSRDCRRAHHRLVGTRS